MELWKKTPMYEWNPGRKHLTVQIKVLKQNKINKISQSPGGMATSTSLIPSKTPEPLHSKQLSCKTM